jgi:hypothetical protein
VGVHPHFHGKNCSQCVTVSAPLRIRTILTNTGKAFTDQIFGLRKRAATLQSMPPSLNIGLEKPRRFRTQGG